MTALGTAHESAIVTWLRENGWPHADRRVKKGSKDEGDIRLADGVPVTIEAKTYKAKTSDPLHLAQWLRELADEIENSGSETGAVFAKRRGTTDVGEYFAILTVRQYMDLITRLYGKPSRPRLRRR
jgi:hypothetical protein